MFVQPLRRLYFHGPENIAFGLGFWQGLSQSEICARIKNTSEKTWDKLPDECEQITEQLFQSFLITVETILWFYILVQILFLLPTVTSALAWRIIVPQSKAINIVSMKDSPKLRYKSLILDQMK